jgi:hypothetical protein
MEKNVNAPENLKVKVSKFKSDLSFNEWAEQYKVGHGYIQPTKYFQGNVGAGIHPKVNDEPTFWEELKRLFIMRY